MLTLPLAAEVVDVFHPPPVQARQRPALPADEGKYHLAVVLERGQERRKGEVVPDPQLVRPRLRETDVDERAVRAVGIDCERANVGAIQLTLQVLPDPLDSDDQLLARSVSEIVSLGARS